ncbi:endo alpha-1,4 polygalactosaminidase [Deinococcus sp.]|uniref:endo alpha-1,4 polygalactosaminidase n=1 Tax=Deinococcus sp. TaxID=47478 RepID=UPI003CC50BBA
MRKRTVGLLALTCLMAACTQASTSSSAAPTLPAQSAALLEAELSDLSQADDSSATPQTALAPNTARAQVISDPAASQGKAVILTPSAGRVTFTVPSSFAAGSYALSIRARAGVLDGNPTLVLRRKAAEVSRVAVSSAGYAVYSLGNLAVQPGDRLSLGYSDDGSGSAAVSARTLVVDYLNLDPTGAAAPALTPPAAAPPASTPPAAPPPAAAPPIAAPPAAPPIAAPAISSGINLPPSGKVGWDLQLGAGSDADVSVPTDAKIIDLDGFTISAAKVSQLKAQGLYVACYLDVGSYESYRPDAKSYPDYLKLQTDPQWPDESFLDVTDVFKPNSVLAAILNKRFQMCKDKGFDAIDPDNLQNDDNVSGGRITHQQQLDFNGWVADQAHAHGLAVFQKNGPDKILQTDRTGKMMVEKFDAILNEQCQEYSECAPLAEYTKRGKLALEIEYKAGLTLNCTTFSSLGVNAIKRDLNLSGAKMSGYSRQTCP